MPVPGSYRATRVEQFISHQITENWIILQWIVDRVVIDLMHPRIRFVGCLGTLSSNWKGINSLMASRFPILKINKTIFVIIWLMKELTWLTEAPESILLIDTNAMNAWWGLALVEIVLTEWSGVAWSAVTSGKDRFMIRFEFQRMAYLELGARESEGTRMMEWMWWVFAPTWNGLNCQRKYLRSNTEMDYRDPTQTGSFCRCSLEIARKKR